MLKKYNLSRENVFPLTAQQLYTSCGVGSVHKKVRATKGSITRMEFIKSNQGKISGQLHHQTVNQTQVWKRSPSGHK